MNELLLFTDGSVNTKTKIGYGACLALVDPNLSFDSLKSLVKIKMFENTSSAKLELQTLLWAISENIVEGQKVIVYTDSQNIIGLPGRRERLEKNNYSSKKKTFINNHELYKEFYRLIDRVDCEFVKVKGHMVAEQKEYIDKLFTLVDRSSRNALRGNIS